MAVAAETSANLGQFGGVFKERIALWLPTLSDFLLIKSEKSDGRKCLFLKRRQNFKQMAIFSPL
jgi:hypothetical protein